jgi:hypothetical protein
MNSIDLSQCGGIVEIREREREREREKKKKKKKKEDWWLILRSVLWEKKCLIEEEKLKKEIPIILETLIIFTITFFVPYIRSQ